MGQRGLGFGQLGAYVPSQTTTELRASLHRALIPVIISSRLSFHLSESTKQHCASEKICKCAGVCVYVSSGQIRIAFYGCSLSQRISLFISNSSHPAKCDLPDPDVPIRSCGGEGIANCKVE